MKKLIALAIGLGLVLSTVSFAQDHDKKEDKKAEGKGKKGKKKGGDDKKM